MNEIIKYQLLNTVANIESPQEKFDFFNRIQQFCEHQKTVLQNKHNGEYAEVVDTNITPEEPEVESITEIEETPQEAPTE